MQGVRLIEISKNYKDNIAVAPLSLEFDRGVSHGLLGANGAGKSTLIKMMLGLVLPDDGHAEFDNESFGQFSFLPEQAYLPSTMTAYQLLQYGRSITQDTKRRPEELLELVGLDQKAWRRPIHTYSKGMCQRTSIAYALIGNPSWLILDEPMSGLDALGRRHILDLLLQWRTDDRTILMSSHIVSDLVRLCDKVHIMAKGRFCETIDIHEHTLKEAEMLEARLAHWNK